jgi:predicted MFS family arabinose efflux permease
MFCIGVAIKAILTIISPFVAYNFITFVAVQVIGGVFEGLTIPCMSDVWRFWAPPLERSRMATYAASGAFLGAMFAMEISGAIAENLGWQSPFFCFGGLALLWCCFWMKFVKQSPSHDRRISVIERAYITQSLSGTQVSRSLKFKEIPWKNVFTSRPVWAIVVADFVESYGFTTLLRNLPDFLRGL